MARTTVDIDTAVLKEIKKLQKRDGRSLGAIISDLLADALARRGPAESAMPPMKWISQPMKPKIDLLDKEAIWKVLDDDGTEGRR
ncbi:MAG TPA: hypothetical protein VGD74_05765 [Vulgatibacter sp.]